MEYQTNRYFCSVSILKHPWFITVGVGHDEVCPLYLQKELKIPVHVEPTSLLNQFLLHCDRPETLRAYLTDKLGLKYLDTV